jgi:hypothetical protein
VLTPRSARARSVARDDDAKCAKLDAKNAQAIDIADRQYCRKRFHRSAFRDSRMMRSMRMQAHRYWSSATERPVRGL